MDLFVYRYSSSSIDTLGILIDESKQFFSYSCEDEFREKGKKIKAETRIWEGRYKLGIRKEETGLTLKHREDYNKIWKFEFTYHIEILNIPDFIGCYVHVGNHEGHTEGCLLLGDKVNNNIIEKGKIELSNQAVERFYAKYYPLLEQGKEIYINFVNII